MKVPSEVGRKSLQREPYTGNKEGGPGTGCRTQLRMAEVPTMLPTAGKPSPGFPGGPVIKSPSKARDRGSILVPHVSGQLSPCATTTEAGVPQSLCSATEEATATSSSCSRQLEKDCAQQWRHSATNIYVYIEHLPNLITHQRQGSAGGGAQTVARRQALAGNKMPAEHFTQPLLRQSLW